MPANVALTPTELTSLAKVNQLAPYYLSFKAENTIATATVSETPTGSSYAQLNTSGAVNWTNIREGMTAKITDSTGATLRGYYRVRRNSNDVTVLDIEEITPADQGIIAQSIRTATIQVGDLITVTDRFDLFSMKPSIAAGILYQDYDIPVGTYNVAPEVIVNVDINSRPGDYINKIPSDGGTDHISAAISIIKWPSSSGSTVTYSWVVPASWTNVTGTTTATLAADVPPGDYTLYCDVTDSVGGLTEIARWVRIHSPSDPPLGVNITSDMRDMQQRKVSIRAVQKVIQSLPPGIKCALWSDATWGGDNVATATRTFIGYLYQQPFAHEPNYYETNADIYSTAAILDTLMCVPMTIKYTGFTTTWEQLAADLQTVQFVMWWVLRWRCANLLKCFNFTPFSTASNIGRRINFGISQGSILAALKNLAEMYEVNIGSRSDGEIISQALPWMLSDRSGVATRCTLTNDIYSDVKTKWVRRATYGSVIHDGVVSNLGADTPVSAQAPGLQTFGQGGAIEKRSDKIYESQDDNNIRVGLQYAYLNSQYPQIDVDIPNNWDVFEPADCNLVTVVVPATYSPTGSAITIDCVPQSVTKTWIKGQRASIRMMLVASTNGAVGQTVPPSPTTAISPIPPISNIPFPLPPIDDGGGSLPLPVPPGQVASFDGNYLLANSDTQVYWIKQYANLTTPQYNVITPPKFGVYGMAATQIQFNPTPGSVGGYALGTTAAGTAQHSNIFHGSNVAAISPVWEVGTSLSGGYTILRSPAKQNSVMAYTQGTLDQWEYNWDFVGTVSHAENMRVLLGSFSPGTGWVGAPGPHDPGAMFAVEFEVIFNCFTTVNSISFVYNAGGGAGPDNGADLRTFDTLDGNYTFYGITTVPLPSGVNLTKSHLEEVDNVGGLVVNINSGSLNAPNLVKSLHFTGFGVNPFDCPVAEVAYSIDNGSSASIITVGDAPGNVGGFDVARNSEVSYAAAKGNVRKASSLGGTYGDFWSITDPAQAVCVHIPYTDWSGNDQTASTTPDVIIALNLPDASKTLIWVQGDGMTAHDITPTSNLTFDNQNCITSHMGTHIAVFGNVSGTKTVFVSQDKGSTWINATPGSSIAPTWIHNRRNNTLPTRGQLYMFTGGDGYYSSYFAAPGTALQIRYLPGSTIFNGDSVW